MSDTTPEKTSLGLPAGSRRNFLHGLGGGFGLLALASLLHRDGFTAEPGSPHGPGKGLPGNALAPREPHFPAKARRVIFLFMHGGPSHLETFDPKPELQRLAGEPLPPSFGAVATSRDVARNPLLGTKRRFARYGKNGIEISDLFPHLAKCVDELAVIRSCWADSVDHAQALYQMSSGSIQMGKPCLGSWVGYGLGTENQELPAFVVLPNPGPGSNLKGGPGIYGSGFLPASYQGTVVHGNDVAILDLQPPRDVTPARQRGTLDLIRYLNARHLSRYHDDPELSARIQSYELAYRMQSAAPEAVDLTMESDETRRLYGLDDPITEDFGKRCLLARRLAERGVRFIQLFSGDTNGWDGHDDIEKNHTEMCARTDKPIAGLLKDLKRRGLLEDTLVIWGGEFGRMPMSESRTGRDHNPHGFTMWMAGAGIKGGIVHGATDPIGLRAAVDRVHVHDIHATTLHLLGLDHTQLTFTHNGREERLTDTAGKVIRSILI
jgi:hypothetical protein